MDIPCLFKALIVASRAKDHLPMSASAEPFFARMAAENHYALDEACRRQFALYREVVPSLLQPGQ